MPSEQSKQLEPQMHTDARRWTVSTSNTIGHSVDIDTRIVKIEQLTRGQPTQFKVVDALRGATLVFHGHWSGCGNPLIPAQSD
jgi:hypothetical protein